MNSNWHNVSRKEPCPICHKPDWCTLSNDGEVCVCRRVESAHPVRSGMGWIHSLHDESKASGGGRWHTPIRRCPPPPSAVVRTKDFAALHATFDGHPDMQEGLAFGLGLDGASFTALDVRYDAAKEAMSFPMRDAEGRISGLRYRHITTGRKWSEKGSKDGLFYSATALHAPCPNGLLYITEGPTDTAAALSLGVEAVGRSSCTSGTQLLIDFIRARRVRSVRIVADNDAPGWDGARRLSAALPIPSRIILPPLGLKDLRAWYRSGLRHLTL